MFIRDDIFDIICKESQLNHWDLVQFRDIYLDKFQVSNLTKVNTRAKHYIFKRKDYNRTFEQTHHKLKSQMIAYGNPQFLIHNPIGLCFSFLINCTNNKMNILYGNIYLLLYLLIKADLCRKEIYHLWPFNIFKNIINNEYWREKYFQFGIQY